MKSIYVVLFVVLIAALGTACSGTTFTLTITASPNLITEIRPVEGFILAGYKPSQAGTELPLGPR